MSEPRPDDPLPTPDDESVPWSRLNARMLFVHPLRELIRYLPILLIALVAGSVGGEPWWVYALSGFGIVVGILQFFTTRYRITPTHVQLQKGILNRRLLSVRRDRIRSIDVDSTLLHRIFGVSVVKVGTGVSRGAEGLEFNAVATSDIPALRRELLRHVAGASVNASINERLNTSASDNLDAGANDRFNASEPENSATSFANLSRWRPSWIRYAPFTLSGVASIIVVAFFTLQIQFFDGGLVTRVPAVHDALRQLSRQSTFSIVFWGVILLIAVASAVAAVRYAVTYGRFTIGRVDATTLHVSHGLLRTRQVTLDENRMRGITLAEPLALRAVGGGAARAIMTGLGRERGGLALLSPPGPREEAVRISAKLLGTAEPLIGELRQHGPRARRRRYTRAATLAGLLAVATLILQLQNFVSPSIWWAFAGIIPASALLAWDRYRGMGHALLPGWLVTRSGSLGRQRSALRTDGIIGWTVRRSYFQRRAGLATLIATTAAGRHWYAVRDLPYEEAWPIIEAISLKHEELTPEEFVAHYASSL